MNGSCLCGDVRFTVDGQVSALSACHCTACRKQSGHYWVAGGALPEHVSIVGEVRWYASSDKAERGFCPRCGSLLFWRHADEAELGFSPSAIDGPTGLRLAKHIYVADKGDHYEIGDGLPQEAGEEG